MLKALIIDDEPLAHEVILYHLAEHADISIVGRCYNATQALSWLANDHVDLLFLDINMPDLSGIELLKVLRNRPQAIVISAYQEYAIQGFELDVTDYLLKPVCSERLSQALDKVRFRNEKHSSREVVPHHIILKVDREKRKFTLVDITLLEAYGNYVKLWQGDEMVLVNSSLKLLIEMLPNTKFTQVHKSFVVNNAKIIVVETDSITMECGRTVKVSKTFKKRLQHLL
ncbi:MAG: response regulator transcription factor [Colwellia sp.]|nr:response regulator transcription factor [Colwellia sp.]